ncbi:hypothetical protein [Nitrospirillum viridazoti]|nr:hypothetical protein [Nitrospirillum amazonense]
MKRLLPLAGLLALAACAAPVTTVRTVDSSPHLAVQNASSTAVLIVDGKSMGAASAYDGAKQVLTLTTGTHQVEVQDQGQRIYAETIYLGDAITKTITVPGTGGGR